MLIERAERPEHAEIAEAVAAADRRRVDLPVALVVAPGEQTEPLAADIAPGDDIDHPGNRV